MERDAAYGLLAIASTASLLSYFVVVAAVVFSLAIGLEVPQHFTPDRHGELIDVIQKLGAVPGFAAGYLINKFVEF